MAPARPSPLPAGHRFQMFVKAAGLYRLRIMVLPPASAIRISMPQISDTSCCSVSRSTSFAATDRSESATEHVSTASPLDAGCPFGSHADVIAHPIMRQLASPRGFHQPLVAPEPRCWYSGLNVALLKWVGSLLTVEGAAWNVPAKVSRSGLR
jgi:hypothetical protein